MRRSQVERRASVTLGAHSVSNGPRRPSCAATPSRTLAIVARLQPVAVHHMPDAAYRRASRPLKTPGYDQARGKAARSRGAISRGGYV
jgi:hypothetical protein